MGAGTSFVKRMNLLYANDKKGLYPQSWYTATCDLLPVYDPLCDSQRADICVIGAGYTGLSSALHLAEAGYEVVILEAQRIGFGASGRNGGQIGTGQRLEQESLIKLAGAQTADFLWELAEESKATVKSLIQKYKIECYLKSGIADLGLNQSQMKDMHHYADFLAERYGYDHITKLDKEAAYALCPSPTYHGGYLDKDAGHLHPLRYAIGLAKAALNASVKIFENTEVTSFDKGKKVKVHTSHATITCDYAVLACNGYLGNLEPSVASRVMPINNFIAATEPLGAETAKVLTQDVAIADSKFVINYFRLSHDGRLLFGGGENYSYRFPNDIASAVRKPMIEIFPHLRDISIDYAWGGTLGITLRRMPFFCQLTPNIFSASGYSGHGVAMATLAGKLVAKAIDGETTGFDAFKRVPSFPFPGGAPARYPLLVLAMTWYTLRDRLGF
jgi:gamma-glutamylputrescine oxidase